ncbi:MAG: hypothetical protein PVF73_04425 [Bacteroidales bacterium]|jgi:hypothetical protein
MKKLNLIILIIFCISCQNKNSDQIILEIGELKVTGLEFDLNKKKFFDKKKNKYIEYSKWKSDYIDRCFIICDALHKGYDTLSSINQRVNSVARFMMVQKYGPLWKKIASPTVDTFKIVTKNKIRLRENLYYFDIIRIDNKEILTNLGLQEAPLNDPGEFNGLKSKAAFSKGVSSYYTSLQWPFRGFWEVKEDLVRLTEGQISKLLYSDNKYYYFYLDKIEKVPLSEKDINYLSTELQLAIEKEIDDHLGKKAIKECKLDIDSNSINKMLSLLESGIGIMKQEEDRHLMTYYLNNFKKEVYLSDFQDYYRHYPLRRVLKDSSTFYETISQYFFDDYLWSMADSLGLPDVDTFQIQRKAYFNKLVFREYLKKELFDSIKIDSLRVTEYYKNHFKEFTEPKAINAHILFTKKFSEIPMIKKTLNDYFSSDQSLDNMNNSFRSKFYDVKYDVKIAIDSLKFADPENADMLISAQSGNIIDLPKNSKNGYCFVCKLGESGQKIIPIDSVYNNIEYKLKKKQFEIRKKERLAKLKRVYTPIVNKIE